MKVVGDDSLLVDISDALSERDRVRFTVHTRTKLAQFAKPVMSVVRQHEEFIWLHDCLEDNDQYAGYIIPPPPPKPDFDASREKLQRLGEGEANMTKEEFAKMKQELEAEYLAIFKKTVAMHEIFLQRLAAHEKFREDNNFKIFLEYENELAVRCKSKKERLAGSISNIGKSLTDFVITTSQVAATTSASASILANQSPIKSLSTNNNRQQSAANNHRNNSPEQEQPTNGNNSIGDRNASSNANVSSIDSNASTSEQLQSHLSINLGDGNNNQNQHIDTSRVNGDGDDGDDIDEQYFEKERLFLALYHNSIKDAANQADKVTQLQKCVADSYLYISQQLIKLASIEVVPITAQTKDSSSLVSCPLPSLTLPNSPSTSTFNSNKNFSTGLSAGSSHQLRDDDELGDEDDDPNLWPQSSSSSQGNSNSSNDTKLRDRKTLTINDRVRLTGSGGCASTHTSEGLKQLLLNVSDYLEQARKIETRIASDEDLKLTDTFLYYKRDTVAAQGLLMRRLRFMAEYETATKNLEKARHKGRTQMQYADVIQKQAKENFISISKLAKQELIDYKQRRVASFKKSFADLVELELKHLRSHSQLITNCLNTCRGIKVEQPAQQQTTQVYPNKNK